MQNKKKSVMRIVGTRSVVIDKVDKNAPYLIQLTGNESGSVEKIKKSEVGGKPLHSR